MAVGVVGTVVPLLPGIPIVWAAAFVYGLAGGFGLVGWAAFAAITVLAVAGTIAGYALPHRRVSRSGAPTSAKVAGLIVGIIGFFVVPIVGFVAGAVLGVYAAERVRTKDHARAWRSTKDLIVGFGLGALAQLVAAIAMVVCWAIWVAAG